MSEAKEITKKSQSNLAFAFISLPKEKRQDIMTFYAFCRHVDDAADDPDVPLTDRRHWLQGWRRWLRQAEPGEPGFAPELRTLIEKYRIDHQLSKRFCSASKWTWSPSNTRISRPCTNIVIASPAWLDWSVSKFLGIEVLNAKSTPGC